jgi:hypothetical protein
MEQDNHHNHYIDLASCMTAFLIICFILYSINTEDRELPHLTYDHNQTFSDAPENFTDSDITALAAELNAILNLIGDV